MPLPAALAARLSKRGLYKKQENTEKDSGKDAEEEVFAEDYDEPAADGEAITDNNKENEVIEVEEEEEKDKPLQHEVVACPNTSNKYHECSDWCIKRWDYKQFKHPEELSKKHQRLLRKYPLPDTWLEVADPSTNRFYYWNIETDHVSWMPPSHPRSKITLPAEELQESMASEELKKFVEEIGAAGMEIQNVIEEEPDDLDLDEIEKELERAKKKKERKERSRDRHRDRESDRSERSKAKKEKGGLDPMDPASYSDIARGGWSAGLEMAGQPKTGVDATASGPLFQQRPYPSPGAVLRANKAMEKKDSDDDDKDDND